jgi:hypothetical protein
MSTDQDLDLFTKEELKYVADRWYFWRGLAIGFISAVALLSAVGMWIS